MTPYYISEEYDSKKRKIAEIADKYSDVIFSWPVCQISYLKGKQYPMPYMYDRQDFHFNPDEFSDIKRLKILHAPSNPFVKGTPLVRAAIKKLQLEGYLFDYEELQGVKNDIVKEHLRSTHIVLNQFYAFTGGVLGVESMANHCAVLMSADPDLETDLPQTAKNAWMITKYWQIYDNLKYLLDNPNEIKRFADNGYHFAIDNYTYEKASENISDILLENGIRF